jgi:glutamate-1-semialdehyde 2,1-aminomutase
MSISELLYEKAVNYIPGGVNSPVRAYQSVGSYPRFIHKADGAYVYDEDNNKYIDYIGSWGPMILGHNNKDIQEAVINAVKNGLSFGAATKLEIDMAELICNLVPSIQMVRMVNSGTEAVMSAIRLARGYTRKDKIIKFEGCYHGHSDSLLVKAGSGVMTAGVPDSAGVPEGCVKDTLTAVYNDFSSVEALFEQNKGNIAAVIIEPVAANMGVIVPEQGFLKKLREICSDHEALLIFDEVITGFRLQIDGAQGYYGITPDLTTFGKIIGGGMPVGAYGGRKEIMECVSPAGAVYQAGTLSGNPIAMTAGITALHLLKNDTSIYEYINELGDYFRNQVSSILERTHKNYQVNGNGSLSCIYFTKEKVIDYLSAKTSDVKEFSRYFNYLIQHGIHVAPSQYEAIFLSCAHTREIIDNTLNVLEDFLK